MYFGIIEKMMLGSKEVTNMVCRIPFLLLGSRLLEVANGFGRLRFLRRSERKGSKASLTLSAAEWPHFHGALLKQDDARDVRLQERLKEEREKEIVGGPVAREVLGLWEKYVIENLRS